MKIKKKLSILTVTALATLAVSSHAFADDTYVVKVNDVKAAVGESITVSVVMDTSVESVGSLAMTLLYDTESLEYQEGTLKAGSDLPADWFFQPEDLIAEDSDKVFVADGSVRFAATSLQSTKINSSEKAEIAVASFKVLKSSGEFSIEIDKIYSTDDKNITDKFSVESTTVQCSHKNIETKTELEDCEKGGKTLTACKDCGETVKTEDIAPSEHNIDKWTVTKEATCTEKGEEEGKCSVCGKTVTRETEMIDHSFGEWEVTTPATCTEKGVETSTCSACGEAQTREIDALGHDFGEWTVVKEATCTEEGTEERICSRCDEKETRKTDKIDHDVEWTVTKEATCTEAGEKTGTCKVCGEKSTEEVPAIGHEWGEWTIVEEATTEKEGTEERECSRCGEKETRTIDKLAPVEDDVTTSTDPAPSAPSNEEGNNGSSNNGSGSGNPATGVVLAVIPLVAAGAATLIFCKKRK